MLTFLRRPPSFEVIFYIILCHRVGTKTNFCKKKGLNLDYTFCLEDDKFQSLKLQGLPIKISVLSNEVKRFELKLKYSFLTNYFFHYE